jgi:hypothetical protein
LLAALDMYFAHATLVNCVFENPTNALARERLVLPTMERDELVRKLLEENQGVIKRGGTQYEAPRKRQRIK